MFKIIIILLLLMIIVSLGRALVQMLQKKGSSDSVVRALSWRIFLSLLLFGLILLGIYMGWLAPNMRPF